MKSSDRMDLIESSYQSTMRNETTAPEVANPPLSSVDLRHHAAATAMVAALQEMIEERSEGEAERRPILIPPEIVIRESA